MHKIGLSSMFLVLGLAILSGCVNQHTLSSNDYVNVKDRQELSRYVTRLKSAAEQGDSNAQYALGYMYYYGKGIPQNMHFAQQWIRKAAAQGNASAMLALQALQSNHTNIKKQVQDPFSSRALSAKHEPRFRSELVSHGAPVYVVQLFGSRSFKSAALFLRSKHLENKASIHKAFLHGEPWYEVIYGKYSAKLVARQKARALSQQYHISDAFVKQLNH